MPRSAWAWAAALVGVVLAAAGTLAEVEVLHSLDRGATWSTLGVLGGDPFHDMILFLERSKVRDSDVAALTALAEQDGLYHVKLKGSTAFTSVRASCFVDDGSDGPLNETIILQATPGGAELLGVTYTISSPQCFVKPTSVEGIIDLPSAVRVQVLRAHVAPALPMPEVPSEFADTAGYAAHMSGQGGSQQQGGGAGARPGAPVGKDGKPMPPPEEKSWWQKNWLIVAASVMMVINVLGKISGAANSAAGAQPARR